MTIIYTLICILWILWGVARLRDWLNAPADYDCRENTLNRKGELARRTLHK